MITYTAVTLCGNRLETAHTMANNCFANLTSLVETNFICDATEGQDVNGLYKRQTAVTTSYNSCTNLTQVMVTVYIKDRRTLAFSNDYESVQAVYTSY